MKDKQFKKTSILDIAIFVVIIIIGLSFIYPLFYMLINSLKTSTQYYTTPFSLPVQNLQIINYIAMVSQFKIFNLFKNTAVIIVVSLFFIISIAICASYAFSKLGFKGSKTLYLMVISTMAIPSSVTIIPMYIMFARVNLINNLWSVILSYIGMHIPGSILLMTSFFRGISNEMIDSSEIDGCNYFQKILNIIVPMGKTAIIISIILNTISMWNDLFMPMIFLQKLNVRTIMVALASLMYRFDSEPNFQFAGLFLSVLPMLLFYVILQKFIVKGISVGSIK